MKRIIVIIALLIFIFVLFFPFFMNYIYHLNPPFDFFNVDFASGDLLAYYGVAFGSFGTILLSFITIIQNKKVQEKTDEVNELLIKIQEKNMEIAEKQFDPSTNNMIGIPKFEVKQNGHHGFFRNPYFTIQNVSSCIISNLSLMLS